MTGQAEFFDNCAAQWDARERADIRERVDRVVQLAEVAPGMAVLDVGTGTGVLIPSLLAALQARGRIVAIDISAGMLAQAQAKGFPAIVEFEHADLLAYAASPASFDRVMLNAVLPHFSDKPAALRRCRELLRPGGRVVISHPVGREAVNRAHASSQSSQIRRDVVPPPEELQAMLAGLGFKAGQVLDEAEFYFVAAATL